MPSIKDRIIHAWNAFLGNDEPKQFNPYSGIGGYSYRPDRPRLTRGNEQSIINAIYNRIAIDCSSIDICHVRLDENGQFRETINSGLNYCLTKRANIDQTGKQLIQDIVMSVCDEGTVAVVPVDTTINPITSGGYDIQSLRVGKITQWYPDQVRVSLYNEKNGKKQEVVLPKKMVAIIENPFYSVMNEPNSILKRLVRKLNILDAIDEQAGAGKLDLIIQLPYVIKTEARQEQAEKRRKDIEMQLASSKYGIAYTDGTEHVTQLNRPVENNLMTTIEYLTSMLYSQLGMPKEVFEGTATEDIQLNYFNTTIEPMLSAITLESTTKFLTKTAQTQGQAIKYLRDPFKLVPITQLPDIADKFTRNEILTSNEVRAIIGRRPSDDPKADELRNKNINKSNEEGTEPVYKDEQEDMNQESNEEYENVSQSSMNSSYSDFLIHAMDLYDKDTLVSMIRELKEAGALDYFNDSSSK